jgi:hypothetical protein
VHTVAINKSKPKRAGRCSVVGRITVYNYADRPAARPLRLKLVPSDVCRWAPHPADILEASSRTRLLNVIKKLSRIGLSVLCWEIALRETAREAAQELGEPVVVRH